MTFQLDKALSDLTSTVERQIKDHTDVDALPECNSRGNRGVWSTRRQYVGDV